ncbi:hypothetical protein VP01_1928g11 [Puccinia sorghi]|uniref:Uncharacterized protein n=1 Tax=Puccinia sorghi TaxID=27349 RepID=A0A0L6VCJ1_9BASI|nr:hypothetical protein VP01_1928g11 [Puccinia sorghi]
MTLLHLTGSLHSTSKLIQSIFGPAAHVQCALLPVTDTIVELLPARLNKLREVLWEALAKLITYPTVLGQPGRGKNKGSAAAQRQDYSHFPHLDYYIYNSQETQTIWTSDLPLVQSGSANPKSILNNFCQQVAHPLPQNNTQPVRFPGIFKPSIQECHGMWHQTAKLIMPDGTQLMLDKAKAYMCSYCCFRKTHDVARFSAYWEGRLRPCLRTALPILLLGLSTANQHSTPFPVPESAALSFSGLTATIPLGMRISDELQILERSKIGHQKDIQDQEALTFEV